MTLQRLVGVAASSAEESTMKKRVGAALVLRNKRVFAGHNKQKTHPKSLSPWSLHAEVSVIIQCAALAMKDLHGATLCVVRLTKSGLFAMSFPCKDCLDVIRHNGISRVVFTGPDRLVYEAKGI